MLLNDCKLHGPDIDNELFIVEGLSAANNVLRARDLGTQAVIALQGKPINAAKASRARVEKNAEIKALIHVLRCGLDDKFQLQALPYKRIVLLFDPDADGIHACALVQIFFQKLMPKLIEAKKLVLVRAPLFEIKVADRNEPILAYSEQHYNKVCEYLTNTLKQKYRTTCFKGVASLSVALLQTSCLNPDSRKCQELNVDDVKVALKVFG